MSTLLSDLNRSTYINTYVSVKMAAKLNFHFKKKSDRVCTCLLKDPSVPTPPRPSFFKNNTSSPTYIALNSPKMSSVGGGTPGGIPPPPPPPPYKPSQQQQRPVPLPSLPDVLRPSEDQQQHSTFFQSRGDYTHKTKNKLVAFCGFYFLKVFKVF